MRGRLTAAVIAAWLAPVPSAAQVTLESAQVPGITSIWNAPPPASPPPASSSGPNHGSWPGHPNTSPSAGTSDQFLAGPDTYAPRYDRSSRYPRGRGRFPRGYPTAIGGYVPYGVSIPVAQGPSYDEPEGRLALRVTPGSAQVFVDGLYVGAVSDFDGAGLWLEAGPRRVELRAEGYETVTFDVRIVAGETVNYRRELERLRPEPPRVAAAMPRTFYVIPGCYAGDKPPRTGQMPSGCRLADLRTVPPVLSIAR